MNENLHISEDGLRFIANYEGFVGYAYDDLDGRYPHKKLVNGDNIIGTLTIGYGHTEGVYIGQTITQTEAMKLLKSDLAKDYELRVKSKLKINVSQQAFDGLVSRAYNVGNIINVATALNKGDNQLALSLMEKPNTSKGQVLRGLTTRRLAEKQMLQEGLQPKADVDLASAVSKIIKSGIKINFNRWKRCDLFGMKNIPTLIERLGGLEFINKKITSKGMSFDLDGWNEAIKTGVYSAYNVRSLLIKFAIAL